MSRKCNIRREENFLRRTPAKTLSWTRVDEINNVLKVLDGNGEKIAALREEETKQTIEVFIAAALPGGMRTGKENRGFKVLLQFSKESKFRAIVQGNAVDGNAMESTKDSILGFIRLLRRNQSGAEES